MAYTFKHGDRPLDDFTIQRAVGRGGFGEVYYAVSDGGREVALKYLRENPHVELRGVSHCMNLKSPHLVSIFDVKKSAEGEYFIVMEYSSGPSLRDLLVAHPNGLGPQQAAFFLREIAKGLGYLHDRGIVHRDLKPGNIFYDEGYVKIGDYGLSKFISVSRHSAQTASVGTVHYMAPEVGSGNYHRGIDIYALGVVLYEMLLGTVPFEGSTMGEVLMKHLTAQPEVDSLPEPFGKIIRKALEKDPKDRYQTVYEMIEDLMAVEDVKSSLVGFNPVSLASVAPRGAAEPFDSPVRSPNPAPSPPPPARDPQPLPGITLDVRQLPPRMAKKIQGTSKKVEQRMRKLEAKYGPPVRPVPVAGPPVNAGSEIPGHWPEDRRRGETIQRMLLALAMTVGLGVVVGFLVDGGDDGFVAAIFSIAGMSGGLALGCRLVAGISRRGDHPAWLEHVTMALPAALFTGGGAGIYSEARYVSDDAALCTWVAIAASAVFVGWSHRIRSGSRGELSMGRAFLAGLFAFIVAAILAGSNKISRPENVFVMAGGVVAASSLVLQALAWLFPLERWLSGADTRRHAPTGPPSHVVDRAMPERPASWPPESPAQKETLHAESPTVEPQATAEPGPFVQAPPDAVADSRPRRWGITRLIGALLGFACFVGLVMCLVYLADGQSSHSYIEFSNGMYTRAYTHTTMPACVKVRLVTMAAVSFGVMLFAFRKTTRFRTGSFYRDTMRPILMTAAMAGVAGSFAMRAYEDPRHYDVPGVKVILIVSGVLFLLLLFKSGHRYRKGESHDKPAMPGEVAGSVDPPDRAPAG